MKKRREKLYRIVAQINSLHLHNSTNIVQEFRYRSVCALVESMKYLLKCHNLIQVKPPCRYRFTSKYIIYSSLVYFFYLFFYFIFFFFAIHSIFSSVRNRLAANKKCASEMRANRTGRKQSECD